MNKRAVGDLDESELTVTAECSERLKDFNDNALAAFYMAEARQYPLLSFSREIELGKMIEPIILVRKEIGKLEEELKKLESESGEWSDAQRADFEIALDMSRQKEFSILGSSVFLDARDELVVHNLRWVMKIARRFVNKGILFQDVVQEGNIGLMAAAEKYEWQRNFRFCTYATWWIRQSIARSIVRTGFLIRMPDYMYEMLPRVMAAQEAYVNQYGFKPSAAQLALLCDTTEERVQRLLSNSNRIISLESPLSDSCLSLIHIIPDDRENLDDEILEIIASQKITERLDMLPPVQREIIERRFGLKGAPETLRAIAESLDRSHERIRQVEAEALAKLKEPHEGIRLNEYWPER